MTKNEERQSWIAALEGAPDVTRGGCPNGLIGLHNPETGNSICRWCAMSVLERGPTLLGPKLKPVWSGSGVIVLCVTCNQTELEK